MKITRTTGKAAGAGAGIIAALLLAFTFITTDDQVDADARHPAASPSAVAPFPAEESAAGGEIGQAAERLAELPTVTSDPAAPYDRDLFGQRWADVDRNGCDTRNDMLARDLVDPSYKPGTNGCIVLTGTLHDPYTGETVEFTRRSEGYQPVQVDHIISLDAAWATGASEWSDDKRLQFANDPINLLITTANQSKGARTPSSWMPDAPQAACTYATKYIDVAHTYQLALHEADARALEQALGDCAR